MFDGASPGLLLNLILGNARFRMREVDIAGFKALLVKDKGEYHAIGPKCTHYGAPLVKGNHHISTGSKNLVKYNDCFSLRNAVSFWYVRETKASAT